MRRNLVFFLAAGVLLMGTAVGCSKAGQKETSSQEYPPAPAETTSKETSSSMSPTLKITAPEEGSTITGDTVTVKVQIENYDVVDFRSNTTPKPGQGHVHIWLDTDPSDPKVAYKLVSGNSATFEKVPAGDHTLTVQLVGNDHKPVEPAVKQVIHFKSVSGSQNSYSNSNPANTGSSSATNSSAPANNNQNSANSTANTPAATAKSYSMELKGFAFGQQSLTIEAGSKVTFTNRDDHAHTVTAKDGSFDSGPISQGQSYTMTFSKPGTYNIYCKPHPFMTATIIVK